MPYAPNTMWNRAAFASRSVTARAIPHPTGLSTFETQKGHRESDAPVVDGVVRVMRAVAALQK